MVGTIKKMLPLIASMLILSGCVATRQAVFDISAENIKNAKAMKQLSKECISVWSIQSGFIEGYGIEDLPYEAVEAMNELDVLAGQEEHSDKELGYFLGSKARLKARLLTSVAPSVIELLRLIF